MIYEPAKGRCLELGPGGLIHWARTVARRPYGRMRFMDERRQAGPADPSGIEEPHDVLAAEEFAMPAGEDSAHEASAGPDPRSWVPLAVIAAAAAVLLLRLRRR